MDSIITWINGWTIDGSLSILLFIPFAAILIFSAVKLVNYAEIIIQKTKFGGAFVGGALIAAATSVPELITDVTQSSLGNPAAGAGSNIGSNAFSMFMIAIAAIILFRQSFLARFDKLSRITMLMSAILSLILSILMFYHHDLALGVPGEFVIGIIPLGFFIFYLISLFIQYKWGSHDEPAPMVKDDPSKSIKIAVWLFIVYAVLIISLSLVVNWFASSMIKGLGLPDDGVGGILLAVTTSFPEIVAFMFLLKRHQPIAAAATLIGSHFFNLAIMFFGDMSYTGGAYFNNVSLSHNWIIALVTFVGMSILFIHSTLAVKQKVNNFWNIALPSLVAITYISGWILQLSLL